MLEGILKGRMAAQLWPNQFPKPIVANTKHYYLSQLQVYTMHTWNTCMLPRASSLPAAVARTDCASPEACESAVDKQRACKSAVDKQQWTNSVRGRVLFNAIVELLSFILAEMLE